MLHMSKHISAFCTRALPCGRGWFAVSCDMQQRGAWQWQNLSVYGWMCTWWWWWWWGGGRDSPSHCMAPGECRLRDPERGGDEGARTPWERRSVRACVSQRERVQSPCLLLFLHPAPSALHGLVLVSTRERPLPHITVKPLHSWCNFYTSITGLPSFQKLYSANWCGMMCVCSDALITKRSQWWRWGDFHLVLSFSADWLNTYWPRTSSFRWTRMYPLLLRLYYDVPAWDVYSADMCNQLI